MENNKLDIWMRFFLLCDHTRNATKLTNYFYQQFLLYPEIRDAFFEQIENLIINEEDFTKSLIYAKKYMVCLSEIFERFGLYKKKCELDDLYFQLVYPNLYKKIESEIEVLLGKNHDDIKNVQDKLTKLTQDLGIPCEIKYRRKNTYSIHRKMIRLQTDDMRKVKDLIGFRIVVLSDRVEDCYNVLTKIHDIYKPEIHSFKDYIQIPKVNGYQSIHTGVYGLWGKTQTPVEIQIKTKKMEHDSMEGGSSHLGYKLSAGNPLLLHQYQKAKSLESDTIQILTKDMDIFTLPKGTTVLDFACTIHSNIADKLMGAMINNEFQPITHELHEGDIVGLVAHPTKRQIEKSWLKIPTLSKKSRKLIHAKTK